ncbi:MAG: reverse transcriptase domain-containing protein [Candidatus Saccharimonadales bacterium]
MENDERYPKIGIRSKNELAKRISNHKLSQQEALNLINDVLNNKNSYWKDSKKSEPEKEKWVRDASHTKYGTLLELISTRVLAPHDCLIPYFIFGGIKGRSCKSAAQNLLGKKRKRVLLKLDLKRFFEQNKYERVYSFFLHKCKCSKEGAKLLADLCCVPFGAKDNPQDYQTIARGFSTSARLAVWCNLDIFVKLGSTVRQSMRGKDPRISIYVDDIGITASKVSVDDMRKLYVKLSKIITEDKHSKLEINEAKTRIVEHTGKTYVLEDEPPKNLSFEFVGSQMKKNSLTVGYKTRNKLRNAKRGVHKKRLLSYKTYIEKN